MSATSFRADLPCFALNFPSIGPPQSATAFVKPPTTF
jgi:hypothetical protein